MKHIIQKTALTLAVTGALVSCGGASDGGGGTAGIGGSGYVSKGSISSFGSVFVNGVEFETTSATFDVEGVPGTQDDLAIGMIVRVNGTINDDGVTGNATGISFDDEIQGPVSALSMPDADGITRTMNVLGVNVILSSGSTVFDISGSSGIPANTPFSFIDIADGNNVEISGFFDTTGNLHATRVELKNITFDASSIIEVKGTITGLNSTTFSLGSLTVDAAAAIIDGLPNGLADGELVEVKGTFNVATTTITASKVEAVDNTVEDTDEFEVEGLVTDYVDDSNFKLDGISIDATNATREPATLILSDDVRVEAEGTIVNGVLIASEIELRGGNAKVSADVTAVNVGASTFEVSPVAGQPAITVTITTSTQMEDDVNQIEPFAIGDLVAFVDFVEIRGFDDGNGGITATEVQVRNSDKVVVQGIIQSGTFDGTVKIYGVEFAIDVAAETEFKDASNASIDQTLFFSSVTFGTTLVKVEDKITVNGIADGIDIETP